MSDAREALADVRGWLCDNLSDKEAGKVCGMLSAVSRKINRLGDENAKLRELLTSALTYIEYEGCGVECPETGSSATFTPCDTCNRYETESCAYVIAQSARELGVEVDDG